MKAMKNVLAKLLVAALLVTSVAIANPNVSLAATKPVISKTGQTILEGKKFNLNVDNKVKGSTYVWKTSNKKVATVNSRGIVTGITKGKVTITCVVTTPKTTYELTSKIVIRKPATKVAISNKVTALNVGQKYNLDRTLTPKASNDLTTLTSSDKTIANPKANGVFTALKEGTVTITAKTLSGAKDTVKIKVVDKDGIVTTQKELDALLGSGVAKITLKTDVAGSFTIAKGDYSKQTLVIDAPNADVTNNGLFKSIEIKQIKENTLTEKAEGNVITLAASKGRVVIANDASATIIVSKKDSDVVVENNGKIEALTVDSASKVTIIGTSKQVLPVVANVAGATITTSLPLDLTLTAKITLVINAGADGTKVAVASKELMPTVLGTGSVTVVVGVGSDAKEETIIGTPIPTPVPGGNGGGNNGGGSDTSTSKIIGIKNGNVTSFELPTTLSKLTSVEVHHRGFTWDADGKILSRLMGLLEDEDKSIENWKNITYYMDKDKYFNINGKAGEMEKQAFVLGREYIITVDDSKPNPSIKVRTEAGIDYILAKSGDKTLTIENAPADLTFTVTYTK